MAVLKVGGIDTVTLALVNVLTITSVIFTCVCVQFLLFLFCSALMLFQFLRRSSNECLLIQVENTWFSARLWRRLSMTSLMHIVAEISVNFSFKPASCMSSELQMCVPSPPVKICSPYQPHAVSATITSGLHLETTEILRSLKHYPWAQSHRHHIINHLEEGSTVFLERMRKCHG